MSRLLNFIYGLVAYVVGLGGLVWFILFVGGWDFLPRHIDSGEPVSLSSALFMNLGLILLFGLQHSVMARQSFKSWWTKIIPSVAERSTYVFFSGIILGIICLFWQPVNGILWHVDNPTGEFILTAGYFLGWVIVVLASFLINHFELFGLQQVYCNLINKVEPSPTFTERFLYKVVRHPLQFGVLIGMWAAPIMSMTHFMLSTAMSVYIFIGLYYEEKDLAATFGESYKDYQRRVRMLIPIPKRQTLYN